MRRFQMEDPVKRQPDPPKSSRRERVGSYEEEDEWQEVATEDAFGLVRRPTTLPPRALRREQLRMRYALLPVVVVVTSLLDYSLLMSGVIGPVEAIAGAVAVAPIAVMAKWVLRFFYPAGRGDPTI